MVAMFETLESAQEKKVVPARLARVFFGTYSQVGAVVASLDLYRHGLHRPVLLVIEILMLAVSAVWLRDSWMGLSSKKFSVRLISLMALLLLSDFILGHWYH